MTSEKNTNIINFSPRILSVAFLMTIAFFIFIFISKTEYIFSQEILFIPKEGTVSPEIVAENISGIMETKYFLSQISQKTTEPQSVLKAEAIRTKGSIVKVNIFSESSSVANGLLKISTEDLLAPVQKIYPVSSYADFKTLDEPYILRSYRTLPLSLLISVIFGLAFSQAFHNLLAHFEYRASVKSKKERFNFANGKSNYDWKRIYDEQTFKNESSVDAFDFVIEKNDFIQKNRPSEPAIKVTENENIIEIDDAQETSSAQKAPAPDNLPIYSGELCSLEIDEIIASPANEKNDDSNKEIVAENEDDIQQRKKEEDYKDKLNRLLRGEDLQG